MAIDWNAYYAFCRDVETAEKSDRKWHCEAKDGELWVGAFLYDCPPGETYYRVVYDSDPAETEQKAVEEEQFRMFWMVLGVGVRTFRHATEEEARKEAERLACVHRGSTFIVLQAVAGVTSDVEWSEAVYIPF